MMLEEDEYKRDDFVTLSIKNKNKGDYERPFSDCNKSDEKSNSQGMSIRKKKLKKLSKAKK